MITKKLSDYTGGSTVVLNLPDYLGQAIKDKVEVLEVSPGQLMCLHSFIQLPVNWDFKVWGIQIKVI